MPQSLPAVPRTPLQDRIALVTGASAGIGAATALRLAREGMTVVATARRADRLQGLADQAADLPGSIDPQPADIRDEAAMQALLDGIKQRHGTLDVLVNNAGLGRVAGLTDGATVDWREMWEVNVLALSTVTRDAIALMRETGADTEERGGHIVHVSSMAGQRLPMGGSGAMYCATKAAVRSLTEGLRRELHVAGSHIRVGSVSPGFVETEFHEGFFHGDKQRATDTYNRYRVLDDADVADAIYYLLTVPAHVQLRDILMTSRAQDY